LCNVIERFYPRLDNPYIRLAKGICTVGYGLAALSELGYGSNNLTSLLSAGLNTSMALELGLEVRDSYRNSNSTLGEDFRKVRDDLTGLLQ